MLLLLKHAAYFSGCNLLTQLVKQIWLVMLMVFAIGWSSVSVASASSMHLVMATEKNGNHCLEMQKPAASHAMHAPDHPDHHPVQQDCLSDSTQHLPDCPDCSTTGCQSLTSSLPIAAPELNWPDPAYPELTHLPAYHAKHLAGYWPEILRPPKA
jgi:hypothetical protein